MTLVHFAIVVFLAVATTSTAQDMTTSCDHLQCETFSASQCSGDNTQGYSLTGVPNFFNHTTLADAEAIAMYIDTGLLLSGGCYDAVQFRALLCGTLLPECVAGEGLLLPNRAMCEAFQAGCSSNTVFTDTLSQVGLTIDCSLLAVDPVPICPPVPPTSKMLTMENRATTPAAAQDMTIGTMTKMTTSSASCDHLQCVAFDTPQCSGTNSQGYSLTGVPNFFNHTTLEEAESIAIIGIGTAIGISGGCYEESKFRALLCGIILPECLAGEGLLLPNRAMCEEFEAGCSSNTAITNALDRAGLTIDCSLFAVDPVPFCPPVPPISKMPTTMEESMENREPMTTAAGVSINVNVSLLMLVGLVEVLRKILA